MVEDKGLTPEELSALANEAAPKISELLEPFMRAGVSVSITHNTENRYYLTKLTQGENKYEILLGIPIFGDRQARRMPDLHESEPREYSNTWVKPEISNG